MDPNHKKLVYGLDDNGNAFEVANRPGLKQQNRSIDHLLSKRDRSERKSTLVEFQRDDGTVHKH